MATDLSASFNEQYNNILGKLKKRFLRKPNISEITNEFNALAIQCEYSEQPMFAGHSYVGAAKCENSVGNFLGEADYYMAAARQFMKAHMKLSSLKLYSPAREDLEAAIGCYMQAFTKYPENSPLKSSILMELSNSLHILNHNLEAIHYYEEALDLVKDAQLKLKCMCKLMELYIKCEKYEDALNIANSIADSKVTVPENEFADVQINRVLMGLLVTPTAKNKKQSLLRLFELVTSDEDECEIFSTELKLQLQSIIICYRNRDMEMLQDVASEAKDNLSLCQQQLLANLIKNMENL